MRCPHGLPLGELTALRTQADLRRAARRRVADAVAEHGTSSVNAVALRAELHAVNEQWAELIRQAVGAGHALADVARAAGVAAPSLYYRLRQPSADTALLDQHPTGQ